MSDQKKNGQVSEESTTEKVVTKYDKKVQRRKEEELKAKKEERIAKIIGIVIAVLVVVGIASVPVSRYLATHSTYVTVGSHDVTEVEFDYYYSLASSNYINTYGSYLSYFGFDPSVSYDAQAYSDTMTWADYFDQMAVDAMTRNVALIAEAKAAGFEYDTTGEWETFTDSVETAASSASQTVSAYCKETFGKYATMSRLESIVKDSYYASAYYDSIEKVSGASEDEITSYYEENKASYDSVDYKMTQIDAEIPEAQTVSDGDGTTTIEPTEEEITAAMEAAYALAEEALENIEEDGEETIGMTSTYMSTLQSDWLFDEARKAGDTTILEDETNHRYYVMLFEDRYLDETASADVRVIITAAGNEEDIMAELEAGGSTEEAFKALVPTYSEDYYSVADGGLYEGLAQSGLDETLADWIFAKGRATGDTGCVTLEDGTAYIMYYVGAGDPEWKLSIANTLLSQNMTEYLDGIMENVTVTDPKGHLVYLKVQAEEAAAEATDTSETATEGTATDESTEETVEGTDTNESTEATTAN